MKLAVKEKTPMGRQIKVLLEKDTDHVADFWDKTKQNLAQPKGSKRTTYKEINPKLTASGALQKEDIDEQDRIALTRMRLGSHQLKIETGRWQRIPPERRMCQCNQATQTEKHVLLDCPLTEQARIELQIQNTTSMDKLLEDTDQKLVARLCKKIFQIFRQ